MNDLKLTRTAVQESIRNQAWMIDERAMHSYLARLENDVIINAALDDPEKLEEMRSQYSFDRSRGEQMRIQGSVAILDIRGVLEPTWNWLSAYYGETTLDVLKANFDAAVENRDVDSIVFNIDSPGGIARGNEELSAHIFEVSAECGKRVRSFVEGYMASAAYYLGSAAQEIIATKTSVVGAIGTILIHMEISGLAEKFGVTFTPIKFGQYKGDGNPYEKLSEQARATLQEMVDDHGQMFVDAVARNRGISAEQVRSQYGDGKAFLGPRALEQGLIERIETRATFFDNLRGDPSMSKDTNQTDNAEAVSREEFLQLSETVGTLATSITSLVDNLKAKEESEKNSELHAKIAAKCRMAGKPEAAEQFIQEGLSLDQVTARLLDSMCQSRDTASDDEADSSVEAKVAKYRREYAESKEIHQKLGVSLESYITARKIEDGLEEDPLKQEQLAYS